MKLESHHHSLLFEKENLKKKKNPISIFQRDPTPIIGEYIKAQVMC
jgi:hypothetical protein